MPLDAEVRRDICRANASVDYAYYDELAYFRGKHFLEGLTLRRSYDAITSMHAAGREAAHIY